MVKADGTYMDDWDYLRDIHGGVCNLAMETVAALLGVELEMVSDPYPDCLCPDGPKPAAILTNKSWKRVGPGLAVYNHQGNYRLIMQKADRCA